MLSTKYSNSLDQKGQQASSIDIGQLKGPPRQRLFLSLKDSYRSRQRQRNHL